MTSTTNVLIVTVTKIESLSVMEIFREATGNEPKPVSREKRTYFDLDVINGVQVFLTQAEMGSGGLDASLLAVYKGIESLSPVAVIMVGIAFGIDAQKQEIGEILVTEQLRPYELQRVGTQNGQTNIILRGDKPHASSWLINHFKSFALLWKEAKVRFGVVLTGEKLVDNVDFRQQLLAFEPEAIGGEMEGAGLYVACQDKKVDWILIKAICDWADGNKANDKDTRQQVAARNAAKFVLGGLKFGQLGQKQQNKTQEAEKSPKELNMITNQEIVSPALAMARRSLAYLEEQAAGYDKLTMPTHLRINLEEKRQQVAELEISLLRGKTDG